MELDQATQDLIEALHEIPVVDAHEHLVPEAKRISRHVDFFILFSHYTRADFISAGMAPEMYQRLVDDEDMPVDEKWDAFEPFYAMIKHGSYARPAQIWLRRMTDYSDFTKSNAREVSALLQRDNRPGLYDQVLRQMCNIQTALVDNAEHHAEYDMDLLKPLWRITNHTAPNTMRRFVDKAAPAARTLDGYCAWLEAEGKRMLKIGTFGIKMICFEYEKPNMQAAAAAFAKLADGAADLSPQEWRLLRCAAHDRLMGFAREHNLTVACHSGVWGDFRDSHPCHLIPLAQAHPKVHFDLFHLGTPFVREAVMIGKMFPNVSLNLCWSMVVSPAQTARMLDECIDLVPMNNIIAFGGDYRIAVEKVYGHLVMAKEVAARVLGKRIEAGLMDQPDAIRVAKLWFHDNAMRIYGLQPAGS